MLDRSNQLPHAEGLLRLARTPGAFLPIDCVPARDGRPDRVVWLDVDGLDFEQPFQEEDLAVARRERSWFVTDRSTCRPAAAPDRRTLDGVLFHVARCGSTLARRLLGAIPDVVVHSEPGILNQSLREPDSISLGGVLAAYRAHARRHGWRAFVKCTSWNLLHADRLLELVEPTPALFIHRDPGEVLASCHGSDWSRRLPESMRDPDPPSDPSEGNGRYLEALMRAGLRLAESGRVRCVEYPDLVDRLVDGDLPEHLGYEVDAPLRERMLELAGVNSKQPEVPFEVDAERKARIVAAVPGIAREAARLEPLHQALRSWSVAP